jgi:hypothetical protein
VLQAKSSTEETSTDLGIERNNELEMEKGEKI